MEERIGGFRLTCPEGFRRMTEEETRGLTTLGEGPWIGLSDPERHMIVTAGLGEHTIPFRIHNPMELAVIDILPAEEAENGN